MNYMSYINELRGIYNMFLEKQYGPHSGFKFHPAAYSSKQATCEMESPDETAHSLLKLAHWVNGVGFLMNLFSSFWPKGPGTRALPNKTVLE